MQFKSISIHQKKKDDSIMFKYQIDTFKYQIEYKVDINNTFLLLVSVNGKTSHNFIAIFP